MHLRYALHCKRRIRSFTAVGGGKVAWGRESEHAGLCQMFRLHLVRHRLREAREVKIGHHEIDRDGDGVPRAVVRNSWTCPFPRAAPKQSYQPSSSSMSSQLSTQLSTMSLRHVANREVTSEWHKRVMKYGEIPHCPQVTVTSLSTPTYVTFFMHTLAQDQVQVAADSSVADTDMENSDSKQDFTS